MTIMRTTIVLDAPDLEVESRFWAELLGGEVKDKDDDWHSVHVNGASFLGIQLAPDHQPPDWPDGAPQQIHLDLHVDDIASAHEHALSVGARQLQPADFDTAPGFAVYADPAGHPFCLCWD